LGDKEKIEIRYKGVIMSLQKKTLLIIFATFLSLGILGYIAIHLTLFQSYQQLEADNIKQDIQRIENCLNNELKDIEKIAADWAYWTDTYDFMLGKNLKYEEDNYDVETLVNLELNVMMITDNKANVKIDYQVDLNEEKFDNNPMFLHNLEENYAGILSSFNGIEANTGIILLPEGPMLVSVCPILRNDKCGSSAGNLILAKYLDKSMIHKISRVTKLSVKIHPFLGSTSETTLETTHKAKIHLSRDTTKVTIPKNKDEISGFALIYDYSNNPILMLEVTVKRDILAKAKQSFTLFGLIFIVAILVVMLVTNSLLNKLIMARMKLLSNQANQIAINRQFDQQLEYEGKDEIASLGATFNLMLKSLLESHNRVIEMNQKLEETVESRTIALKESNKKLLIEVKERDEVQKELESYLAEKDILLKEVYHRVKNNLQVITSLLNLQSGQSDSAEVKSALQASRSRVHSMSLVHEQLYRSDSLRYISIKKYLNSIVAHLFGLYSSGNRNVTYEVFSDEINMTVNQVIPCGLIVTELVSNSFKYAFKDLKEGRVIVQLQKHEDNCATLEISDNGNGLPKDFDPANSRSLGLKLVDSLSRQLGGKLVTELENSKFSITFKYAVGEE